MRKLVVGLMIISLGILRIILNLCPTAPVVEVFLKKEASKEEQQLVYNQIVGFFEQKMLHIPIEKNTRHLRMFCTSSEQQRQIKQLLTHAFKDQAITTRDIKKIPFYLKGLETQPMRWDVEWSGGTRFVVDVNMKIPVEERIQSYLAEIMKSMTAQNLYLKNTAQKEKKGVIYFQKGLKKQIVEHFQKIFPSLKVSKIGLGNLSFSLSPDEMVKIQFQTMEKAHQALVSRFQSLGLTGSRIIQHNDNTLYVDVPYGSNTADVMRVLQVNGRIKFKISPSTELNPSDKLLLTGEAININQTKAKLDHDGKAGLWIQLNPGHDPLFYQETTRNVGSYLQIIYTEFAAQPAKYRHEMLFRNTSQEVLLSAIKINRSLHDSFYMSGMENIEKAYQLEFYLQEGAFPTIMHISNQEDIPAPITSMFIDITLMSLGFILLVAAAYYRLFGIITTSSLLIHIFCILNFVSSLDIVLSLMHITVILVSTIMALWLSIYMLESIKMDMRAQYSLLKSIQRTMQNMKSPLWSSIALHNLLIGIGYFLYPHLTDLMLIMLLSFNSLLISVFFWPRWIIHILQEPYQKNKDRIQTKHIIGL